MITSERDKQNAKHGTEGRLLIILKIGAGIESEWIIRQQPSSTIVGERERLMRLSREAK